MRRDRDNSPVAGRAGIDRAIRIFVTVVVLSLSGVPFGSARSAGTERITLDDWGATIEYRGSDERVATEVASISRDALPRIAAELGLGTVKPFRVFLVPHADDYGRRMGFALPPWGIAFAFGENQIMVVDVSRATNAWNSLDKVIPHELSHLLLAQRAPGLQMPLWFMEGLAQWQAREWTIVESWRLMEAVWGNRAPDLDRIAFALPADESRARDAYRVSYAAFLYRFDEHPEELPSFLDDVVRRGDFRDAFESYWGENESQFSARFAEHLSSKYKNKLLLFQTGPLFTLASVLFIVVMLRTWIVNRRRLKRMAHEEREWPS